MGGPTSRGSQGRELASRELHRRRAPDVCERPWGLELTAQGWERASRREESEQSPEHGVGQALLALLPLCWRVG